MLDLSKMNKLADGARNVEPISRNPVKTQFIKCERDIVERFFRSQKRDSRSARMQSFFALCPLLGKPLDASKWHLLEDAAKDSVRLHFLVGRDKVVEKTPNDWQLKCLGLAEIKVGSGVFVVGLNQIFYSNVTSKDLLPLSFHVGLVRAGPVTVA